MGLGEVCVNGGGREAEAGEGGAGTIEVRSGGVGGMVIVLRPRG